MVYSAFKNVHWNQITLQKWLFEFKLNEKKKTWEELDSKGNSQKETGLCNYDWLHIHNCIL